MRIVFDTNIYLASLKAGSLSFQILELIVEEVSGYFLYISPDLKSELFDKLDKWEKEEVVNLKSVERLKSLIKNFIAVAIPREKITQIIDDPDDDKVLECAVAAKANVIVTMDKHPLKLKTFRNIAIVHPNIFKHLSSRE